MIINTGQRTDIPAYYSRWFYNRIHAGTVLVRNPYYPSQVSRYRLDPEVVDLIAFCTKNPAPMLDRLDELSAFRQFWFVTITPYGREIEPHVPKMKQVIESFRHLSDLVSPRCTAVRYDPIFLSEEYPIERHIEAFSYLCDQLEGFTDLVVISFIDLYKKTKRNFPGVHEVSPDDRKAIGQAFGKIAAEHRMRPYTCLEGQDLEPFGFCCSGCMTKEVLEYAIGEELRVPASRGEVRKGCRCLIGNDIGAYNSCGHGCIYCYANQDPETVAARMKLHDPDSPFLIGNSLPGDTVRDVRQERWATGQRLLNLF